jgi:hypothetical protein
VLHRYIARAANHASGWVEIKLQPVQNFNQIDKMIRIHPWCGSFCVFQHITLQAVLSLLTQYERALQIRFKAALLKLFSSNYEMNRRVTK